MVVSRQVPCVIDAGLLASERAVQDKHADAAQRALLAEQMLGIVAHDLRNPLLAIKMATEILARQPQDARTCQLLEHITHSAERAERLVADLLDYRQVRVGRGIVIQPVVADLQLAVAHCVDELRLAYPHANLLHLCLGQGRVAFDPDRFCQLIGNLVSNALAYGNSQAPVTVTSQVGVDRASIVVHNQGTPIVQEHLNDLFEPMIRGHGCNLAQRSVGLGLFIVRQIARAHQGEVTVQSSWRDGTAFTFSFPRC